MSNQEQFPVEQHYNDNEFGLKPQNIGEKISPGFTKTFSHSFIRDRVNRIWRAIKSDSYGNLKISPGTQSTDAPIVRIPTLTTVSVLVLPANEKRRGFVVLNTVLAGVSHGEHIVITYPNISVSAIFDLAPGLGYSDDSWSGDVNMATTLGTSAITVIEYF